MNYFIIIILALTLLSTSCVKEEGTIESADTIGNTSGGTTGTTAIPGAADPLASQAWHLGNTAQTSFSTGIGIAGEDSSIADAIDLGFTGEGVRIAVSDTGTDIDHEDLTATQLVGEHRNYAISNPSLWRSTLPYYVADDAHGTAVAGLIAAEGWNGIGSRGVAPDARYAAFRFVGDYTASAASFLARTIDQTDGEFDIFNYSYGYDQCEYAEVDEHILKHLKKVSRV
jgi:subtilisin family serine protease